MELAGRFQQWELSDPLQVLLAATTHMTDAMGHVMCCPLSAHAPCHGQFKLIHPRKFHSLPGLWTAIPFSHSTFIVDVLPGKMENTTTTFAYEDAPCAHAKGRKALKYSATVMKKFSSEIQGLCGSGAWILHMSSFMLAWALSCWYI